MFALIIKRDSRFLDGRFGEGIKTPLSGGAAGRGMGMLCGCSGHAGLGIYFQCGVVHFGGRGVDVALGQGFCSFIIWLTA